MGLDNTYGDLSGMFCGGLSYDGFADHSSSSDYFRFSDPLPAVVPQIAAEPYSNPSSTVSRANNETDNPEDWEFVSDESLNYISRMLMEEDIDEKCSMYQAESAALRAAAKPFYDILGHKFPPSPDHQLTPWSVDSPSESGSSTRTQSVASTVTSSSVGGSVDSNRRYDVGLSGQMESYRGLCAQSPQLCAGPSSEACSAVDVLEDPLITNGRIPEYLFESLPTWDFRRGIEEAKKFLPVTNTLVIDLEAGGVARSQEARKDVSLNARKADVLNNKKNRQSEDLDLMEGRNIKQSAFCSDEPDWIEMFDDLLRQTEKKATDLRELMRNEASKNSQVTQTKGPSGPRTRGRKPTKKDVVDLRTILIHCAQAVAADDRRTANELLKQIRQHSKPNGDGTQRLAHCFADGLEARLAGTGSQLYHKLVAKRTTASDMLKAYHLYLAACPFKRLSHFLSNQTILSVIKNAPKVHIIDFGIYFGFQWPCLIRRLSKREGGPPVLRITGIDVPQPGFRPTERIEETGQRLADYAKKFNVPFEYQGIASKWETIRVEDLKVGRDEVVIVNCLYRFRNLIDETVAVDSPRNRVHELPPASAPSCFLNLNWNQSMAGDHLDPALSSMVSSPPSNSTAAAATDGLALHGISPQPQYGGTPLSSPPKLNLSMMGQFHHYQPQQVGGAGPGGLPLLENLMPMGHLDQFLADPGFAERAARLSGFDGRTGGHGYVGAVPGQFGLPEAGPVGALKELELGNGRDESSVSDPASASAEMALKAPSDGNAKKRKASGKGKGKDGPGSAAAKDLAKDESSGKRCKSADEGNDADDNSTKGKAAQSNSENGGKKQGKDSSKLPEPPKDYIHVRARRGEATDSHSLAERVRREKISQRMKLLQDLVPGCNKVVGKAVMLDEIINYVQSLQRQVEFLSMKLATVNPQLDFNNLPNLLLKDIQQSCGPLQNSHFPLETSGAPLPYLNQTHQGSPLGCSLTNGMDNQSNMHALDPAFCRQMNSQHPFLNGVSDAASQVGTFWQDDLQSVVHMDIGQNQEIAATSSNSYNGSLQTVHMKMEL